MANVLKDVKKFLSIPDDTLMQLSLPAALLMFAIIVPWGKKTLMNATSIVFAVKGTALLLYPEAVKFWVSVGLHIYQHDFNCLKICYKHVFSLCSRLYMLSELSSAF